MPCTLPFSCKSPEGAPLNSDRVCIFPGVVNQRVRMALSFFSRCPDLGKGDVDR